MKVALSIGSTQPAIGGGYTFVVEVLKALARVQGTQHAFTLCHHGSDAIARMFPGLPEINLPTERHGVLSARERLFQKFPSIIERAYGAYTRRGVQPSWEDRVLLSKGIEFVVKLNPWSTSPSHLPFASVLWDLQHRINPWFPEVGEAHSWEFRERLYAALLGRASIIYTGTKEGRAQIERYYDVDPARIVVLPFPVPEFARDEVGSQSDADVLARLNAPKEYVFYPAQFWAHKNHVAILEACKIIREENGWDLGVVFTGADHGNSTYIREYAGRLGLDEACRFLGFIDRAEIGALYRGAFCLAFPTFFGPDNLPPLEAFTQGCPVVASAVPGATEQLGDAALLFEPTDERALAEHFLRLRNPDVRATMVAAGYRRSQSGPTWDDYASGIISSLDVFAKIRRTWK